MLRRRLALPPPHHLAALIDRYATAANLAREAIDQTDDAADRNTAGIFTAYSPALDKARGSARSTRRRIPEHIPASS